MSEEREDSEDFNPEENPFEDHHDAVEKGIWGIDKVRTILADKKKCINCQQLFTDKNVHSLDGWKEVAISQMCEDCFDEITKEEE